MNHYFSFKCITTKYNIAQLLHTIYCPVLLYTVSCLLFKILNVISKLNMMIYQCPEHLLIEYLFCIIIFSGFPLGTFAFDLFQFFYSFQITMENSHLCSLCSRTHLLQLFLKKSVHDTTELYDLATPLTLTVPKELKAGAWQIPTHMTEKVTFTIVQRSKQHT